MVLHSGHEDAPAVSRSSAWCTLVTVPDGERGPLGPPPTAFRFRRRTGMPRFGRALPFIIAAAVLIILFVIASTGKDLYADLLWFDSVGYRSVYTTRIVTRIWLFFAGAGVFLALSAASILLARRLAPSADDPDFEVAYELREVLEDLQSPAVQRIVLAVMLDDRGDPRPHLRLRRRGPLGGRAAGPALAVLRRQRPAVPPRPRLLRLQAAGVPVRARLAARGGHRHDRRHAHRLRAARGAVRLPRRRAAADRLQHLARRRSPRHQAAPLGAARRAAADLRRTLLPQHVRTGLLHAGRRPRRVLHRHPRQPAVHLRQDGRDGHRRRARRRRHVPRRAAAARRRRRRLDRRRHHRRHLPRGHPELHRPAERGVEGDPVPRAQHRHDALRIRPRPDRRAAVPRERPGDRAGGQRQPGHHRQRAALGSRSRCAPRSARSRRSGRCSTSSTSTSTATTSTARRGR